MFEEDRIIIDLNNSPQIDITFGTLLRRVMISTNIKGKAFSLSSNVNTVLSKDYSLYYTNSFDLEPELNSKVIISNGFVSFPTPINSHNRYQKNFDNSDYQFLEKVLTSLEHYRFKLTIVKELASLSFTIPKYEISSSHLPGVTLNV